jgi:2'-5' RNA ligase
VTRVAVIAYLSLAAADREWIEAVRAEHDPQAARLAAHVTLVFPAAVAAAPLIARVRSVTATCRPFPVALAQVMRVCDAVSGMWHVFLVPALGQAELVALHERLYDVELRRHLRADVPFVAHVTVGASADEAVCARLAARLEREGRVVGGSVDGLEVVEVGSSEVHSVAAVALGGSP